MLSGKMQTVVIARTQAGDNIAAGRTGILDCEGHAPQENAFPRSQNPPASQNRLEMASQIVTLTNTRNDCRSSSLKA